MVALLQRVIKAYITIDSEIISAISHGLHIFLNVAVNDKPHYAQQLSKRVAHYKIFNDAEGRMNYDLHHTQGDILVAHNLL